MVCRVDVLLHIYSFGFEIVYFATLYFVVSGRFLAVEDDIVDVPGCS